MLLWEYLGVMAKLGPFCKGDKCSVVRGSDRLITHLVWLLLVHVSLELVGSLGVVLGAASVLVEGVGAMDVAGTTGLLEVLVQVLENWMAHFSVCSKCFAYRCYRDFEFVWRYYDGIHNI